MPSDRADVQFIPQSGILSYKYFFAVNKFGNLKFSRGSTGESGSTINDSSGSVYGRGIADWGRMEARVR